MLDDEAPRRYDPVQWEGEDRFLIPCLSVRLRIVIERHCERARTTAVASFQPEATHDERVRTRRGER